MSDECTNCGKLDGGAVCGDCDGHELFEGRITALEQERAELQRRLGESESNYAFMVERAADARLDGYRELGQRAANAETRADQAEAKLAAIGEALTLLAIDWITVEDERVVTCWEDCTVQWPHDGTPAGIIAALLAASKAGSR